MIRVRHLISALAAFLAALSCLPCCRLVAAEDLDYLRQIKPILQERCFACHGALKQEGGLRLDTGASIRRGGDSGAAVSIGKPGESYLVERITAEDESYRMPPEGKPLSQSEIELFRKWIEQGARSPADEQPEADPRDHWAFQVPQRPELPPGAAHPIDALLAADTQALRL